LSGSFNNGHFGGFVLDNLLNTVSIIVRCVRINNLKDLELSLNRTGDSPDRNLSTGAPRWVKVFGIIAFVLVLVFVILHLAGHGFGGHGMHGMEHAG
jgi:hypothetical protein